MKPKPKKKFRPFFTELDDGLFRGLYFYPKKNKAFLWMTDLPEWTISYCCFTALGETRITRKLARKKYPEAFKKPLPK